MNTNDEMQTFLRDGLLERYYTDAKESVTTFEREVQERLVRQFEVKLKSGWSNFHAQRAERGHGKAVQAGLSEDGGERPQIWVRHYDENRNYIELGIEWGTFEPRRPILFALYVEGGWEDKLHLSDPKPPVQNHEGYLFVTIGDGFELEPMARLLLDETDRALAGVKPVA